MQLTLFTDYSFRVLIYLSLNPEKIITISEIAKNYNISRNHLVKVIHNLAKRGYIESIRGKGGGLRLAQEPTQINVGSVFRHTESLAPAESHLNKDKPTIKSQQTTLKLKLAIELALEKFVETLDDYYVSDLLGKKQLGEEKIILDPTVKALFEKLEIDSD